jgi:hypothetical protein
VHPRRRLGDVTAARKARREAEPIRITTAPVNSTDDIDRRRRRYVVSMSIRTLCFVGAVLVGDNWFRWVLVAGAFTLPYIAVVLANVSAPRIDGADLVQPGAGHRELGR